MKRTLLIIEVIVVLALGGILTGLVVRSYLPSQLLNTYYSSEQRNGFVLGLAAAQVITIKFVLLNLAGWLLLRWKQQATRKTLGLTRSGHTWKRLLGIGVVLFAVSELPMYLVFAVDRMSDLGPGLPMWEILTRSPFTPTCSSWSSLAAWFFRHSSRSFSFGATFVSG